MFWWKGTRSRRVLFGRLASSCRSGPSFAYAGRGGQHSWGGWSCGREAMLRCGRAGRVGMSSQARRPAAAWHGKDRLGALGILQLSGVQT